MSPPSPIPALVLAGGRTGAEFAAAAGVPDAPGARALAEIDGRPMLAYVLRALRRAETISRTLLLAPGGFPPQPDADAQLVAEGTLVENIQQGLAHTGDASHALLVTADIPFVTAQAIDDYVCRAFACTVDCCYAAIPIEACEARFPGTRRTTVPVGGRRYTGGNVVLQRAAAFPRMAEAVQEAYRRRKNPLFLARMIGLGNVGRLLVGRLTLADIEAAGSRVMGCRCGILVTEHAELGTDVDKPADLELARRTLHAEA